MKEPLPPKTKAAAPRKEAQPARPAPRAPSRPERRLKVRFYCSMKPQRIYPLRVEAQSPGNPSGGPSIPLVIRPVVAGALVTPAEQKLNAAEPGARVTFHVTPLGRGRVPDARVEVHQQGRQTDQIRLRMKAVTQRRTWIMLLLTILLPSFILLTTNERFYKLKGTGKDIGNARLPELAVEPGDILKHRILSWTDDFLPKNAYTRDYVIEPVTKGLAFVYNWACHMAPDHLYFWVGLVLLGLTFVSWVGNRNQRATRYKPLQLAAVAPPVEAGETLPLNPRDAEPVAVRPAEK